ncbi:branched-chain amino acid transaminase [Gloeobacter kilaueensis]|uniref:Branched-chain-amino-acid aminotransferase n=1 Tax=Gloeobacter kilaueensis (strain ATCC BAA-2537 / CCAP 1431/1 / ULC 316 / JS1) TaxID=1183438 RepID=U5QQ56_GLOK1|nr:branched-chain amino acid transaminase [Gloeobacter kilaueensis]AGY59779.1 branched-chain amino acid aminotransferase [Gloeobacter kilaueensis JS1]
MTQPVSEPVVYLNGQFVPDSQANISVRTHSFLYGTAVFEGIKAYWVPERETMFVFRAEEHYRRLLQSCRILRLTCPIGLRRMVELSAEIVARNGCRQDTYLRPIVYKVDRRIGPSLVAPQTEDDFLLFSAPMSGYLDTEKGLHVCVSSWRRLDDNMIPARAKVNGAYVNTALAKSDATLAGFDDAIVLSDDGHVSEGSAMNLFVVRDGRLITPSVSSNILEGITRATVIELAQKELGLAVEARPVDRTELYTADELFLCGTATEVAPVTRVDHRAIADGSVGPITRAVRQLYAQVVRAGLPDYLHWLTPATAPVLTQQE